MVWWPFATKPEKADTSEVTDLHSGAPPLYSTSVAFAQWLFWGEMGFVAGMLLVSAMIIIAAASA
jgi:hypothetical protein